MSVNNTPEDQDPFSRMTTLEIIGISLMLTLCLSLWGLAAYGAYCLFIK